MGSDSTPLTEELRRASESYGAVGKSSTRDLLARTADALAVSEARVASLEEAVDLYRTAFSAHRSALLSNEPESDQLRALADAALAAGVVTNGET